MAGIIDADTHISESEAMWAMMDKEMYPRRPVLLKSPEDTLYGPRNAFWLIDGNIFPKPNGKGSFRLITPSASKLESSRGDIHLVYREMTDIPGRLKDMDKLGVDKQVVFPTLFLIYITDDGALDVAMARAYNRFLAQACAKSGGRMQLGGGAAAALGRRIGERNKMGQRQRRGGSFLSRYRRATDFG